MNTREKMDWLVGRKHRIEEAIRVLQDNCKHPADRLSKIYKSNTGNYDPYEDCYWVEYTCGDCDKWWMEEQGC